MRTLAQVVPIEVAAGGRLSWFFRTDGELFFGVFRHDDTSTDEPQKRDLSTMHMAHPWLRVGARFVPERGRIESASAGVYYFVFCNRSSWFTKRQVHIVIDDGHQRRRINRLLSD